MSVAIPLPALVGFDDAGLGLTVDTWVFRRGVLVREKMGVGHGDEWRLLHVSASSFDASVGVRRVGVRRVGVRHEADAVRVRDPSPFRRNEDGVGEGSVSSTL